MRIVFLLVFLGCVHGKDPLVLFLQEEYMHKAYFSWPGRFTDAEKKRNVKTRILQILDATRVTLDIFAYTLTDPEILAKIDELQQRGVAVHIRGDQNSNYDFFLQRGIPLSIWSRSGIHHIKAIVADNIVFTGTGNFTEYGLERDYNGYIEFRLTDQKRREFVEFLSESYPHPVFVWRDLYFIGSPRDGSHIQKLLLREIDSASHDIQYLIFNHYDELLSEALRRAHERGVAVKGVYNQPIGPEGEYLSGQLDGIFSGIKKDGNEDTVFIDGIYKAGLLHHKTMLLDNNILITGSYNYSSSARDNNREIIMYTKNPWLVAEFAKEFERVAANSYALYPASIIQKPLWEKTLLLPGNCIDRDMQKPFMQTGRGIFKNHYYYASWKSGNCFDPKSFSGATMPADLVATNIPGISMASGMELEESLGAKRLYTDINPASLMQKQALPKWLQASGFFAHAGGFEFMSEPLPWGSRVYYWTPGRNIVEGNLTTSGNVHSVVMALDTLQIAKAMVFIETPGDLYFFCHDSGNDRTIEWFLREIAVWHTFTARAGAVASCI